MKLIFERCDDPADGMLGLLIWPVGRAFPLCLRHTLIEGITYRWHVEETATRWQGHYTSRADAMAKVRDLAA